MVRGTGADPSPQRDRRAVTCCRSSGERSPRRRTSRSGSGDDRTSRRTRAACNQVTDATRATATVMTHAMAALVTGL